MRRSRVWSSSACEPGWRATLLTSCTRGRFPSPFMKCSSPGMRAVLTPAFFKRAAASSTAGIPARTVPPGLTRMRLAVVVDKQREFTIDLEADMILPRGEVLEDVGGLQWNHPRGRMASEVARVTSNGSVMPSRSRPRSCRA